ncbi:hypothetical protein CLV62_10257 [Dysgonomonas alginatilytica]|uniref:Uncharacterized protein n=1 Tax=Dysgonomonas alginatilytica TaxID=1605892 RepID=A0A2V3PS56_9BACT|nr:hypothetical protein [Dysgonomonas alginatilytica]PXV68027.1 hypothetical protein CLV62_10257 [Dysgonomonas alginatilytica]
MTNLLNTILSPTQPECQSIPEYVGKTFDSITAKHQDYKALPYVNKGNETLLVEIRFETSILSCIIENDICTEAYIFTDV